MNTKLASSEVQCPFRRPGERQHEHMFCTHPMMGHRLCDAGPPPEDCPLRTNEQEDHWLNWTHPGDGRGLDLGDEWRPANIATCPDPVAARDLAWLMSDYSEAAICAGWIHGLEFLLWGADVGFCLGFDSEPVTQGLRDKLRELSDKCGGWIVWDDDHGETWVPLAEWTQMVEARRG